MSHCTRFDGKGGGEDDGGFCEILETSVATFV